MTNFLCGPCHLGAARAVVRFNGGAQAAHNVVTTDGRQHTFAQFGSGTFTPGVRTHLSRFMLVDPLALASEAAHLASAGVGDALDRLTVDRDALLTTPYHRAANQARELARGVARHGSCGVGIGESAVRAGVPGRRAAGGGLRRAADAGPVAAPAATGSRTSSAARGWRDVRLGALPTRGAGVADARTTTWSTATFANAESCWPRPRHRRWPTCVTLYPTFAGPWPWSDGGYLGLEVPEPHNQHGAWQGAFRTGHFDAVALRYAVEVSGGVDAVALTHLDTAARHPLRVCRSYQIDGQQQTRIVPGPERDLRWQERLTAMLLRALPVYEDPGPDWPGIVEDMLGAPVVLRSYGPTAADKRAVAPIQAIRW